MTAAAGGFSGGTTTAFVRFESVGRIRVGGAGRAFSWLVVGAPHPFFLLLMTIELALPPLLVLLWWRAGGPSASKA
jgi:hypothetical protein